ncbi:MAG: efflux transporter outer membrane subunit, partial [Laribacter sp.]|nr:efflux transporter outer membrane subunit [Laribacter sp.]
DEQLDISRRTLKSREEALQIYAKRYHGGLISELDYRQAEAETATARVAVPRYEQAVSQAETALKVLVGANPREVFEAEVPRGEELSQIVVPPVLPDGTPSTLLLARPDLVSAEQQLIAANARIGVARAAYFPSISLTGAVGSASLALGELFTGPAALWNYGGALAMPVFNWGKTGAGVKAATAQQKEALAGYEQAVQNAFRDTRDALTAQQKSAEQLAAQDTQVNALQRTAHLARLRYENGYSSYLDVLDAERSLFSSELDRANARLARLNAAVSVYRALGGGYDQPGAREIPPPVLVQ